MPSPPLSPPLAARHQPTSAAAKTSPTRGTFSSSRRARRGGAAQTITGECERLFCETLRTVFLGEGNLVRQNSLVTGVQNNNNQYVNDYGFDVRDAAPSTEVRRGGQGNGNGRYNDEEGIEGRKEGIVSDWVEVWDYVGGNRFRGFVAENQDDEDEKTLFVFFDQLVIGGDLKAALMALLELCELPHFSCTRLVACLDRHADAHATEALTKDLGWIGFQLATLNGFTTGHEITSEKWLFMDMDV